MNIQSKDSRTCLVTGLQELVAANANAMRDQIRAALPATCVCLELDLSTLTFLDSSGLGTLVSLHKTLRQRDGAVRLLQPAPNIRLVLELTRLNAIFEITS